VYQPWVLREHTATLSSGLTTGSTPVSLWAVVHGDAVRNRVPDRQLPRCLARRLPVRHAYGSYDLVWWLSIALGLVAALLHWPIDERAVARLRLQT
jgi:hypothetical protein